MVERCGSGLFCRGTTCGEGSRLITTRFSLKITLSPGRGYFQASSSGWPTLVEARYISPTPRASCLNVEIRLESGDHKTTGLSLFTHPALLMAYPKCSSPS